MTADQSAAAPGESCPAVQVGGGLFSPLPCQKPCGHRGDHSIHRPTPPTATDEPAQPTPEDGAP